MPEYKFIPNHSGPSSVELTTRGENPHLEQTVRFLSGGVVEVGNLRDPGGYAMTIRSVRLDRDLLNNEYRVGLTLDLSVNSTIRFNINESALQGFSPVNVEDQAHFLLRQLVGGTNEYLYNQLKFKFDVNASSRDDKWPTSDMVDIAVPIDAQTRHWVRDLPENSCIMAYQSALDAAKEAFLMTFRQEIRRHRSGEPDDAGRPTTQARPPRHLDI